MAILSTVRNVNRYRPLSMDYNFQTYQSSFTKTCFMEGETHNVSNTKTQVSFTNSYATNKQVFISNHKIGYPDLRCRVL